MTEREIKNRINQINMEIFNLEMKDHWDNADYDLKRELDKEKKSLEQQLKEG